MTEPKAWQSAARRRLIEQGELPADIDEREEKAISEAVQRILGSKPAQDAPEVEAAEQELSKSEQRRQDRKAEERARRFGR